MNCTRTCQAQGKQATLNSPGTLMLAVRCKIFSVQPAGLEKILKYTIVMCKEEYLCILAEALSPLEDTWPFTQLITFPAGPSILRKIQADFSIMRWWRIPYTGLLPCWALSGVVAPLPWALILPLISHHILSDAVANWMLFFQMLVGLFENEVMVYQDFNIWLKLWPSMASLKPNCSYIRKKSINSFLV